MLVKKTVAIPKKIAEKLGIDENSRLVMIVDEDEIEMIPLPDAVTLSLRGRKIARITLRELEEESMCVQEENKRELRYL
ncbi:MAG: AbrB/MazE/SpoVT family DNA-binding domain-containing protein [Ignisphaera sp.]